MALAVTGIQGIQAPSSSSPELTRPIVQLAQLREPVPAQRVPGPATPQLVPPRAALPADAADDRLASAIATAQRSALTIETVGADNNPSKGAGVVVAPGYATVAAHMVGPGRAIYYSGVDAQGRRVVGRATLVGTSPEFDIAVVRLENEAIRPARYSAQKPRLGDTTIVVGAPYNFQETASVGVVSGLHRDLGAQLCDCFQTDAPVNPGNSGGATFNSAGEITGQIVGVYQGQGIGFVTTSETLQRLVPRLMRGNLPIAVSELGFDPLTLAQAYATGDRYLDGAVVTSITPSSAAARAGLRVGDRIVAVDDQQVVSIAQTRTMVALVESGQRYRLRVVRGAQTLDFTLTR